MPESKSSKRVLDADPDGPPAKRGKSSKDSAPGTATRGDDGEIYWELSNNRRVSITSFKGKSMLNIREYYEKDGKHLPGKKGIALPMEQYETLLGLLPKIEEVLKEQGIEVTRPEYGSVKGDARDGMSEVEKAVEEGEEEADESKHSEVLEESYGNSKSKLDRFKFDKKNHEATSDEED